MKKDNIHNINKTGFKTPETYFESFDANLLQRLNEKESISASDSAGFSVPKNYFDSVENKILDQLNNQTEKPVVVLKPRSLFYYVAGIAASVALLFSLIFNSTDEKLTIDTLETASIENYLYQEDYSNDELASLFKSDDISETDFIDIYVSDDTLNEYLENIDTEDFILN